MPKKKKVEVLFRDPISGKTRAYKNQSDFDSHIWETFNVGDSVISAEGVFLGVVLFEDEKTVIVEGVISQRSQN